MSNQEYQLAQQFYEIAERETRGLRANYEYTKEREEEFRRIPIRTLITDPYFLNLGNYIYPSHLDDIEDLFEERKKRPINLALFEESIGSGKTLLSSVLIWLQWYEVATIVDPQVYFNLVPGSTIAIMTLSRTEMQSRRVVFSEVWNRFQSQFNKDYFPPNPRYSKEISIEQNNTVVYAGTSSELSMLGYNLYSAIIDEANFLEVIEGSRRGGDSQVYDAAEAMYNATWNRMVSRFMKNGKVPGFIIMISSRKSKNSFMERKIKEGIEKHNDVNNGIFFRVKSLWEAKPESFFPSKKYFYIDTDTLKIVPESQGKILYSLQKKLIKEKVRISGPEPEFIGLY